MWFPLVNLRFSVSWYWWIFWFTVLCYNIYILGVMCMGFTKKKLHTGVTGIFRYFVFKDVRKFYRAISLSHIKNIYQVLNPIRDLRLTEVKLFHKVRYTDADSCVNWGLRHTKTEIHSNRNIPIIYIAYIVYTIIIIYSIQNEKMIRRPNCAHGRGFVSWQRRTRRRSADGIWPYAWPPPDENWSPPGHLLIFNRV